MSLNKLANNKIRAISGQLSSQSLKVVNLKANLCINEEIFTSYNHYLKKKNYLSMFGQCDQNQVSPLCEAIGPCKNSLSCCRLTTYFSRSLTENTRIVNQSEDDNVEEIDYNSNAAVEFLLVDLVLKFRKLRYYEASNCGIREIFFENFRGFSLETMDLSGNVIANIKKYTFNGLTLKTLKLGKRCCSTSLILI